MKILQDKYPLRSYKGQMSEGRYIDGYLYNSLEVMAKAIKRDMTFLGVIFSSTLEVGTGKSVMATQIGEAWTDIINKKYKTDIQFTNNNVVWRPEELIKRSFQLPKYSCILLDEWEDNSYWSKLGMTLRQFFRKCRQLNLFMLCIIPNWFQLPMAYAISRSVFAIDVKFEEDFSRGYFDFYNFESKKKLYIYGKKTHNYNSVRPTFKGRFTDGYGVEEEEYRRLKKEDMLKWEDDEPKKFNPELLKYRLLVNFVENIQEVSVPVIAKGFGVTKSTAYYYVKGVRDGTVLLPEYKVQRFERNPISSKENDMVKEMINEEKNEKD